MPVCLAALFLFFKEFMSTILNYPFFYCNGWFLITIKTQILRKEPGQISEPLDFRHMLTVKRDSNQNTPPGSPATIQRLRVARKYSLEKCRL